jgi:hypothetical protein
MSNDSYKDIAGKFWYKHRYVLEKHQIEREDVESNGKTWNSKRTFIPSKGRSRAISFATW